MGSTCRIAARLAACLFSFSCFGFLVCLILFEGRSGDGVDETPPGASWKGSYDKQTTAFRVARRGIRRRKWKRGGKRYTPKGGSGRLYTMRRAGRAAGRAGRRERGGEGGRGEEGNILEKRQGCLEGERDTGR